MLYVNNNNIINTAFFGETELTKIFFNGMQVWAKAITSVAWNWCDTCVDYITSQTTGIPSKALPVVQAAGGTFITLTPHDTFKYLLNTDATEAMQITIHTTSITYNQGDTLDFVNAGSPYMIHNGITYNIGIDKPDVYFSYANNY
ncbi:MAG: hypothetical protein ACWGHH_06445 [Sulfurovaceae bacterium]